MAAASGYGSKVARDYQSRRQGVELLTGGD